MTDYHSYTDKELLELVASDDPVAFEVFYDRYWSYLYQFSFYILRDGEASKDIVQNVFTWLWKHRRSLEIKSVNPYLKAAVRFKIANYLRDRRNQASLYDQLAALPLPDGNPDAEELAEIKELQFIIQRAINGLPQKCRHIYLLSRNEQLSNREIAERLGISIKTVENQMTIALRKIREAIGPAIWTGLLIDLLTR